MSFKMFLKFFYKLLLFIDYLETPKESSVKKKQKETDIQNKRGN
jgi:hypothetical protein